MKFIVKQAAPEAAPEKPVELSLQEDSDGWMHVTADGSSILAFLPDGTVQLFVLDSDDRACGFIADTDGYIKVHPRKPC